MKPDAVKPPAIPETYAYTLALSRLGARSHLARAVTVGGFVGTAWASITHHKAVAAINAFATAVSQGLDAFMPQGYVFDEKGVWRFQRLPGWLRAPKTRYGPVRRVAPPTVIVRWETARWRDWPAVWVEIENSEPALLCYWKEAVGTPEEAAMFAWLDAAVRLHHQQAEDGEDE